MISGLEQVFATWQRKGAQTCCHTSWVTCPAWKHHRSLESIKAVIHCWHSPLLTFEMTFRMLDRCWPGAGQDVDGLLHIHQRPELKSIGPLCCTKLNSLLAASINHNLQRIEADFCTPSVQFSRIHSQLK